MRHFLHVRMDTSTVAFIKPHKDKWVHHEVRGKQHVEYNAHVQRQFAHEVVDGVRHAKHEVTEEHRQHGPRGLVHVGD